MAVHTIRLRAGWHWWAEDEAVSAARRVDLPAGWIHDRDRPIRLARSFQRPPLDEERERLELSLGNVPGLVEVRLNGQALAAADAFDGGPMIVPIPGPLLPRNRLELLVMGPGRSELAGDRPPWGAIALVIRAEGPARAEGPSL